MPFVVFFLLLAGAGVIFVLYPHLRMLAGAVFVFFAGLLGYLVADQWLGDDPTKADIGSEVVTVSDLRLIEGSRFQKVTGRVLNGSDSARLRSFDVHIQVLDCPDEDSAEADCAIIADDTGVARVDVPPGQVRDFEATLGFIGQTAPKGVMRWTHEIGEVRATP